MTGSRCILTRVTAGLALILTLAPRAGAQSPVTVGAPASPARPGWRVLGPMPDSARPTFKLVAARGRWLLIANLSEDGSGPYRSWTTSDSGRTWKVMPAPVGDSLTAIVSLTATADGRGVMGTQRDVYISPFGDDHWSPVGFPKSHHLAEEPHAIHATSEGILYVGTMGGLAASSDGGRQYAPVIIGRGSDSLAYVAGLFGRGRQTCAMGGGFRTPLTQLRFACADDARLGWPPPSSVWLNSADSHTADARYLYRIREWEHIERLDLTTLLTAPRWTELPVQQLGQNGHPMDLTPLDSGAILVLGGGTAYMLPSGDTTWIAVQGSPAYTSVLEARESQGSVLAVVYRSEMRSDASSIPHYAIAEFVRALPPAPTRAPAARRTPVAHARPRGRP
jgi:hypothetical protein